MRLRGGTKGLAVTLALTALASSPAAAAPSIGHVFIIVLENKGFDETFGTTNCTPDTNPLKYLACDLPSQGKLLTNYYGIGHLSLDNYIAMVSGQSPNLMTQTDGMVYADFVGAYVPGTPGDQAFGQGCVYPANVPTIVGQLDGKGKKWKGYMGSMLTPCLHPALNSADGTQKATTAPGGEYASRHNPFNYFHSIIDDPDYCSAHVVPLEDPQAGLAHDLASAATTPNYVFITPDLCEDGHDAPCADGRPGGLTSANSFVKTWVPAILGSPAYQADGLLLILFDEAEVHLQNPATLPSNLADAYATCGQLLCPDAPVGPNSPIPGIYGQGGGRTGAVAISPFITNHTPDETPYDHYSMLRSIEDLFGLAHIGFASRDSIHTFCDGVYACN